MIAVPGNPRSVRDVGIPNFPVVTYRDVRRGRAPFPDAGKPDIIHAFTPREGVRELTQWLVEDVRCAYVVHLEDNEEAVLAAEVGLDPEEVRGLAPRSLDAVIRGHQFHPLEGRAFLAGAAGLTVAIDRLLELHPGVRNSRVVWPGFDEAVLSPATRREEVRDTLGIHNQAIVIAYTGNVHPANVSEVAELYEAIAKLRHYGNEVVLVKTGWNGVPSSSLPPLGAALIDLGWVARRRVPGLLAAADILIQPGAPGAFNDYRFPSKLPEYLASGRPVVLPRTNIGLHLEDRVNALLLDVGDADEIVRRTVEVIQDEELRRSIGTSGRAFALRELRWASAVVRIESVYRDAVRPGQ